MNILVVYATIEGQSKKIADHIADRLGSRGHEARVFSAMERTAKVSIKDYEKIILVGSVHERRHPKPFEVFLAAHSEGLAARKSFLVSVSMSAAFSEGEREARDYVDELLMRTGFEPTKVLCIGGAIKIAKYDYYALQVLRHVVMRGRDIDPAQSEHEFTDWTTLNKQVDEFVG